MGLKWGVTIAAAISMWSDRGSAWEGGLMPKGVDQSGMSVPVAAAGGTGDGADAGSEGGDIVQLRKCNEMIGTADIILAAFASPDEHSETELADLYIEIVVVQDHLTADGDTGFVRPDVKRV